MNATFEQPPHGLLVATLGLSWAVIPESLAMVSPQILDLFANHSCRPQLDEQRRRLGLPRIGEVWIATTNSSGVRQGLDNLYKLWSLLSSPPALRVWLAQSAADMQSASECRIMRELLARLLWHATSTYGKYRVVVSLAGGRKTMSADIQWAANLFGCATCLHVIDRGFLPAELRNPTPELLSQPLPQPIADALDAVFLQPFQGTDLLEFDSPEFPKPELKDYPITVTPQPVSDRIVEIPWTDDGRWLLDELQKRDSQRLLLYAGHVRQVLQSDKHANWYSLFLLTPRQIAFLRSTQATEQHRQWIEGLPKADLHCHFGGVLDIQAQKQVAQCVWDSLTSSERHAAQQAVEWGRRHDWPDDWNIRLRRLPHRTEATAALLRLCSEDHIYHNLFCRTEPRLGLKHQPQKGFPAYELPGELSGSALLQREAAVPEYVRQLYRILRNHGLIYCEVRGSPHKYLGGNVSRFFELFHETLNEIKKDNLSHPHSLDLRFIVVIDRRMRLPAEAPSRAGTEPPLHSVYGAGGSGFIEEVVRLRQRFGDSIVGIDVAGDEEASISFADLARQLEPAFRECMPVTIHAGEGVSAENIWAAAYALHAERIGHALTLRDNPTLARRLQDRNVAIEMCPTSNVEVVGFRDPQYPETERFQTYPLQEYYRELGLPVVICTDNPGISRTSLATELLRAARMAELTLWDVLALIRAAFEHAFASAEVRGQLLRRCDTLVMQSLTRYEIFPT